jgi:hypothetical protein
MARYKGELPYIFIPLAALVILFWPAVLNPFLILHNTFGPYTDTLVIHWPKAHLMAQNYAATGELPAWTPMNLSGMPLAANQLAMLSYPPAWLFLFLPLEPLFNMLFIFHLFLGSTAIYTLSRGLLNGSRAAAMIAALTFGLSGKWLAHTAGGHVSMVGAIAWLAWTLVAVHGMVQVTTANKERFRRETGLGWMLLAIVTLAAQIVTHTLPVIYTVYVSGAIVLWHHVVVNHPVRLKGLLTDMLRLAIIFLLAGLLAARQLLPLLELAGYSNRALTAAQAAEFALSPLQLIVGLLLPTTGGGHEYVIYLGLIPLLLLPFGISRAQKWSLFYGLLLLVTVLFALGDHTPVHRLFYTLLPGFSWVRTPARSLFVGAAALAVLVGFAADRVNTLRWSGNHLRWLTRGTVALVGLALFLGLGLGVGFDQWGRNSLALMILLPLTGLLLLFRAYRYVSAPVTTGILAALLVIDLASFGSTMMRFVPPAEAFAPGREAALYLSEQQNTEPARVYSPSYSLPSQTVAAFGLETADGVEPVHLAAYDVYMAEAGGYQNATFSVTIPNFGEGEAATALQYVTPDLKLLGMLNVTHLTAEFPLSIRGLVPETTIGNTHIYQNSLALPRAWVAYQTMPAETDWIGQLQRMPSIANVVLLSAETTPHFKDTTTQAHPAQVTGMSANRITLQTTTVQPGWLVVSEMWYPGWQATVNGQAAPVAKVNGILRGVYLPNTGPQTITIYYQPWTLIWGERLAIGTALLLLIIGLFHFGRFVLKSPFIAHSGVTTKE